jgi:hypothetical protein
MYWKQSKEYSISARHVIPLLLFNTLASHLLSYYNHRPNTIKQTQNVVFTSV